MYKQSSKALSQFVWLYVQADFGQQLNLLLAASYVCEVLDPDRACQSRAYREPRLACTYNLTTTEDSNMGIVSTTITSCNNVMEHITLEGDKVVDRYCSYFIVEDVYLRSDRRTISRGCYFESTAPGEWG